MSTTTGASIIPCLRYRNAPEAIDWLCRGFGFEKHLVVPGENGTILHSQLKLGNSMIMVGSVRDDTEFGRGMAQPDEAAGRSTQSNYVVVTAIEAHYERAKAAGAEIVYPIADQDYGGKVYGCRDCEGHLWSFGSYDPWAG